MAKISIVDLHANDSGSSLIFLQKEESGLIQTAVDRALDVRRIGGGGFKTAGIRAN